MLGRKLDEHVFERRADYVNLDMANPDFAQLFLNLGALDVFIDQQMHRLAKDGSAAHSAHLVHGMARFCKLTRQCPSYLGSAKTKCSSSHSRVSSAPRKRGNSRRRCARSWNGASRATPDSIRGARAGR